MKDKIAYLMKSNDLTTTRFAEILEIQPSTISHLVSGRNKPGYDLLQKILRTFPRVNPDWLLLDAEEPYRSDISDNSADSSRDEASESSQSVDIRESMSGILNRSNGEDFGTEMVKSPQNRSNKSPIFVVVFYDDGSCENFSMR